MSFHSLWGKAVGQPGYDKQEWQAECNRINAIEAENIRLKELRTKLTVAQRVRCVLEVLVDAEKYKGRIEFSDYQNNADTLVNASGHDSNEDTPDYWLLNSDFIKNLAREVRRSSDAELTE